MISKNQTIPQVLQQYPQARRVFDQYGLKGCGGESGPQETLEFFSMVHRVKLSQLLTEIEAAAVSTEVAEPYVEGLADTIYKRFFRAALLVMLAAGASTGVFTLIIAALRGSFTSADTLPLVQAHANAQIFGWIGLFVMGFAFQGLPRFKTTRLWRPEIGNAALVLMLSGIALRLAGALPYDFAPAIAVAGGGVELAAVALFLVVILRTLHGTTTREPWDKYVFFSLASLAVAAVLEPIVTYFVLFAPNLDVMIERTGTLYEPFREIQLFGFAGMMVLGIGQRVLPAAFGFRDVRPSVSRWVFHAAWFSLLCNLGSWIAFRTTGQRPWAVVTWGSSFLFYAALLAMAFDLRGFRGGASGRSRKFIQAAFWWLLVAMALWCIFPLHASQMGSGFPHGVYGASRHAFAVGFLSMMILGVSAKVVPVLKGIDPTVEPGLWSPFILINAGLALRVVSQTMTDHGTQWAFTAAAVSGPLMAFGFFIWGFYMWRLIGQPTGAAPPTAAPDDITIHSLAADVANRFPQTLDVFEAFGFGEIRNPILRNTLARRISLKTACSMKNINSDEFVAALRRRAGLP
jgi:hypothetical protein